MIIYLGNKATERDSLDFLTDMLADGYSFEGISWSCAKLKYTGHHDRSSKIGVMSKDDYDRLTEREKADFKYVDEAGGNVFYKTKKSIGDNNFYRNRREEKERNPSNYIIGGLVAIAVIVIIAKVILSLDTQSVLTTLGEIFLQPIVFFMVLLPALIMILAWIVYKLKVSAYEADDTRESRKKARKAKLVYHTVIQFAIFVVQIGIALAPLLHR
mgnify:CR=1 FL=1